MECDSDTDLSRLSLDARRLVSPRKFQLLPVKNAQQGEERSQSAMPIQVQSRIKPSLVRLRQQYDGLIGKEST